MSKKAPIVSVVDDDRSVREAAQALIRSLGYGVVTFSSAEEYLQYGPVEQASCLITDVQMPGMNGVELQRHLNARGRRTPVIFITAFPDEWVRAQALEAGAFGFLHKPIDTKSLVECLDRALKDQASGSSQR